MLVLTRKLGEDIVVDGPALIRVVRLDGNIVKLGFLADESTRIVRGELLERDDVPRRIKESARERAEAAQEPAEPSPKPVKLRGGL